ncbi:MAG: POTRA domain-containing protein, partial [Verrucomicrobiota bacterium]
MNLTADFKLNCTPPMYSKTISIGKNCPPGLRWWQVWCLLVALGCQTPFLVLPASADEPAATNEAPHFNVQAYVIEGNLPLPAAVTAPIFAKYTGTNVSLQTIVQAASDLQAAYLEQGDTNVNIVVAPQRIVSGTAPLNVFQGAFPQIVISGQRYSGPESIAEIASALSMAPPATPTLPPPAAAPPAVVATNPPAPPKPYHPPRPATPEELAAARDALMQKIAEQYAQENDHRVHV